MSLTVIYPGTFDPFTLGHADLVSRALGLFGRLIIGVAAGDDKKTLFSFNERVELIQQEYQDNDAVTVLGFKNLLTEFAREQGASMVVRGLRAVSDFEYEFQLTSMNRQLSPKLESVFMMPDDKFSFVSSSLVREIAYHGGDLSMFVSPAIGDALSRKLRS